MCEHEECEHSLGPSSHCTECDRLALDAAAIREAHKQLQAVAITDPKELRDYIREAMTRKAKKRHRKFLSEKK